MAKKPDLPKIKLTKDEKIAKLLIWFVYGVLFFVSAAGAFAVLYLIGVLVF